MPQPEGGEALLTIRVIEAPTDAGAGNLSEWFELWPHESITSRLPKDFHLRFVVRSTEGDVRRIWPGEGPDRFLIECGLLGQVVLEATGQWNPQEVLLSNLHRMVFQQRTNIQERRQRAFNHHKDLLIAVRGRDSPDEWNVLPTDLQGSQPSAAIERVLDDGAAELREQGFTEPDFETRLLKGLLAAARRSPIELDEMTSAERNSMVRFLLFDAGEESYDTKFGRMVTEHKETVTQRLLNALTAHLEDDTDAFRRYFLEKTNDLIHRVSKQRKQGGPIPRAIVREIRLQILVDAAKSIARCIWTVMSAIESRLPGITSEHDLEYYCRLYRPQAELDSISLAVLADWLTPLQLNPYTLPVETLSQSGILLQVVRYYAEMVDRARAADRQYKVAQTKLPAHLSDTAWELTSDEANERTARRSARTGTTEIDVHLATRIADRKQFDCRCDCEERRGFVYPCAEGESNFSIEIVCSQCQYYRLYPYDDLANLQSREKPEEG